MREQMSYYYPTLHELVSIIPVAQTQTFGSATLNFLSIDCYTDGWIINLRTHYPEPHVFPVFNFHPKRDQRHIRRYGGSSGFGPWRYHNDEQNAYLSFLMHPALEFESVPLEFIVDVIRFTDRPRKEGGLLVAEVWGPWHFEVDLSGSISVEEREPAAPAGPARNRSYQGMRHEQTMPVYGPVFDTLLDIFYKYDPYGIAWSDPSGADWYADIMIKIVHGLSYARFAKDVVDILIFEFKHRWDFDVQRDPRFEEMVAEVWEAWQREGQREETNR